MIGRRANNRGESAIFAGARFRICLNTTLMSTVSSEITGHDLGDANKITAQTQTVPDYWFITIQFFFFFFFLSRISVIFCYSIVMYRMCMCATLKEEINLCRNYNLIG